MFDIKIAVIRKSEYNDLIDLYENPIEHECEIKVGEIFISKSCSKPSGFCDSAWQSLYPFVFALSHGAQNFYDGWMKDKSSALISCNDGFRPVSFLLETLS